MGKLGAGSGDGDIKGGTDWQEASAGDPRLWLPLSSISLNPRGLLG